MQFNFLLNALGFLQSSLINSSIPEDVLYPGLSPVHFSITHLSRVKSALNTDNSLTPCFNMKTTDCFVAPRIRNHFVINIADVTQLHSSNQLFGRIPFSRRTKILAKLHTVALVFLKRLQEAYFARQVNFVLRKSICLAQCRCGFNSLFGHLRPKPPNPLLLAVAWIENFLLWNLPQPPSPKKAFSNSKTDWAF